MQQVPQVPYAAVASGSSTLFGAFPGTLCHGLPLQGDSYSIWGAMYITSRLFAAWGP